MTDSQKKTGELCGAKADFMGRRVVEVMQKVPKREIRLGQGAKTA